MRRDTEVVFLHHLMLVFPADLTNSESSSEPDWGPAVPQSHLDALPEAQAMQTDRQDFRGLGSTFHCGTKDGSVSERGQRGSQSQQPFCPRGGLSTLLPSWGHAECSVPCLFQGTVSGPWWQPSLCSWRPGPRPGNTPLHHARQLSCQVGDAGSSVQPRCLQPAEHPQLDS